MDIAIRIMAAWVVAATFVVVAMQPLPDDCYCYGWRRIVLFTYSYYIIIAIVATVIALGVC